MEYLVETNNLLPLTLKESVAELKANATRNIYKENGVEKYHTTQSLEGRKKSLRQPGLVCNESWFGKVSNLKLLLGEKCRNDATTTPMKLLNACGQPESPYYRDVVLQTLASLTLAMPQRLFFWLSLCLIQVANLQSRAVWPTQAATI